MADILMMEPDLRMGMRMSDVLSRAGHRCTVAQTVAEGMAELEKHDTLLTVLNARLPWTDSFSFLRALAERGWPVLFTTEDQANVEHLKAMYQANCDVLVTPCDAKGLVSAVSTLLKNNSRLITLGSLQLDVQSQQVTKDGVTLPLTAQEFALLHALMQSPNATLTREQLLRTAWGYQGIGETRTVDVHIQRLRRKLGTSCIETVYKLGYRLKMA